jgi:hypothetical protein
MSSHSAHFYNNSSNNNNTEETSGLYKVLDEIIRVFAATPQTPANAHSAPVVAAHHLNVNQSQSITTKTSTRPPTIHPSFHDLVKSLEPTPIAPSGVQFVMSPPTGLPSCGPMLQAYHQHEHQYHQQNQHAWSNDNLSYVGSDYPLQSCVDPSMIAMTHGSAITAAMGTALPTTASNNKTTNGGALHASFATINENPYRLGIDHSLYENGLQQQQRHHQLGDHEDRNYASSNTRRLPPASTLSMSSSMSDEACGNEINDHQTDAGKVRRQAYQREQWYQNFEKLLQYKAEHGHCNVPYLCEDNKVS